MRLNRFEQFARHAVERAGAGVLVVETFAEAGYTARPAGLVLRLGSGGQVYVQLVRTSPPGGDKWDEPERIVEGEPPPPVPVPALDAGRVRMADLESWLVAVLASGGSREIASVRGFSEDPGPHRWGFAVHFHSGAHVYGLPLYTVPAGGQLDPRREFQPAEVV